MSAHPHKHPNGSLYCNLMEFIKWRVDLVYKTIDLVKQKKHYLDNRSAAEFCMLQLRFCCELLAIGCVAIHTDVPQSSRLQTEWNADKIMNTFEKLKPEFFPLPMLEKRAPDGVIEYEKRPGGLTKEEFLKSYRFFGGLLHTGSFKGYKSPKNRAYDFQLLVSFIDKLVNLLNAHYYELHEKHQLIRVIMNNVKDGRVWLNELQRVPRSSRKREDSSIA